LIEDEQEKAAARNQLIAIFLMMGLALLYFNFFAPEPTAPPPGPMDSSTTGPAVTEQGPSDALRVEAPIAQTEAPDADGWPNLPPPAESTDPETDDIVLRNNGLELVFTRIGGRLKNAYVLLSENGQEPVQLVPEPEDATDPNTVYPFGLRFTDERLQDELDYRRFDIVEQTERSVVFSLTLPGAAEIRKSFFFDDASHVLDFTVDYKNLEAQPRVLGMDQDPAFVVNWGPNVASQDFKKGVRQMLIWRVDGANDWTATVKMEPGKDGEPFTQRVNSPDWIGVKSAYFMVAFRPEFSPNVGWAMGTDQRFRFGIGVPRTQIEPGDTLSATVRAYVGPNQRSELKAAWPTLESSFRFFEWPEIMNWFAIKLLSLLNWFYGIIPNYGVAIILLTVLVRTAMFPLTIKQMRSMKRMQLLAPEMEKIKKECGEDPQELNRRMMEMYKERGVNPLGGCFPMMLQMPVFIALYRMLWSTYELRGAPFALWIKDLSQPDQLFHFPFLADVPFVGEYIQYLNVLPILCAVAMIVSTKLMPMSGPVQNPQQKAMMTIMPVFFSVICYSFASGLNLYILTSTILGIAQNRLIRVSETDVPEKKPVKKKRHWYAAAQAKRRQSAKDMKEAKDNGRARASKKKGGKTTKPGRSN
jgi:YidC/Oxa1 family membrane protein insertase